MWIINANLIRCLRRQNMVINIISASDFIHVNDIIKNMHKSKIQEMICKQCQIERAAGRGGGGGNYVNLYRAMTVIDNGRWTM